MSDVDNPPKVLQLTSTIPSEGKTTVAIALACSAARSGLKVLIVDADMRHPPCSNYFKADKKIGLVEYLVGEAELQAVVLYNSAFVL
jgi:succinoglycan biosynthesis transport protein ExoP